jgi:uncharacterized membrane protein required for colicin V production
MQVPPTWPAPLDLVGLGLIALLLVLGLYRGLWWQVMRLVGVTLSVLAARAVGAPLAQKLSGFFPELEPRTAHGLAWLTLFLTALLACALLGLLGQRMLEAMKLDLANRLAGAFAGAATGFCAHVVVVVLLCQLAPPRVLGQYVVGTYSERLYSALGVRWSVVMAADAAREVDHALENSPRPAPRPPAEAVVR